MFSNKDKVDELIGLNDKQKIISNHTIINKTGEILDFYSYIIQNKVLKDKLASLKPGNYFC